VEGAEDHGDGTALFIHGGLGDAGHPVEVVGELLVVVSTGHDARNHVAIGVIEGATGDKVVHMGGEGLDGAELVGGLHQLDGVLDVLLRCRVSGRRAVALVAEVPAEDRRVIARSGLDVGQGPVGLGIGEGDSEFGVLLVPEEDSLALLGVQVGEEGGCSGGGVGIG